MKRRGNIGAIVRKEFSRFFGDKALVFSAILLPGLLIYSIYSAMGDNLTEKLGSDSDLPPAVYVDNMPESLAPLFDSLPIRVIERNFNAVALIGDSLGDKKCNLIYVNFPPMFDSLANAYKSAGGETAPNVRIYHNSASENSDSAYKMVVHMLDRWEQSQCNMFDINAQYPDDNGNYDVADKKDVIGNIFSQLIPMLILMLLFSGCMAVAPASIAGEKERGTIATLLVTPMKRYELAVGKIISLSVFALLSGLSSFIGIILSLPKMAHSDELGITLSYTTGDYLMLLGILLSTVLVIVSFISIISAYAKTVKNATTMVTPLMLVVMFLGLSPMLGNGAPESAALYLIPFYNSVQSMSAIFAYDASLMPVLVTYAANICYTVIAVYTLTRMFSSEKVMFSR